MSFTNEQLNWMNKSGEFGLMGDVQFSGDIPYSPPPPLPLVNKSSEPSVKNGNLNQGLGATEAAAAETMREVIRENTCDRSKKLIEGMAACTPINSLTILLIKTQKKKKSFYEIKKVR